ncbi:MAG: FAD-dependent oxidoreductase [Deltaproteobacteria bacterium]|nr:FAD-dependent oxidoreductase [Deltaproteobacteria bacterium]MBW2417430.1 FAD-dependent oxidoreductase [Deltaproteobacteria bacterium]
MIEKRADRRLVSRRRLLQGAAAAGLVGAAGIAPRPVGAGTTPDWDAETDVLVVGLGAAGASAAIAARAAGAEVSVLEAAPLGGGTSRLSAGEIYLGGGTPLQRRLGFDDSSAEMIKYLLAASGAGVDEEKIRLYCEGSLDHYAWLLEQGVEFKPEFYPEHHDSPGDEGLRWAASEPTHPFNEIARPAPRSHKMRHSGLAGGALMDVLIARCAKLGAQIHTQTTCRALVTSGEAEQTQVLGVVAHGPQGERRIRARGGVVLATGGFISNAEMVRLYAPLLVGGTPMSAGHDDGSGILMGIGLGAAALHMDAGFIGLALHPPEEIIQGVLVDPRGQRFVNEDAYLGRVGEYARGRADGDVILILDAGVPGSPLLGDNELVARADSAQALQERLGRPALAQTLAAYNANARVGKDPLFGKQPEFLRPLEQAPLRAYHYELGKSFWPVFTLGGLRTRPSGEVLRASGAVISGLYAAGRAASGVPARAYNTGTSVGDGTFFGRRAGQSAAARRAAPAALGES